MGVDIKSWPAWIRAFFNGISQVVFIENVISGIIFWASFLIAGLEMNGWNWGSWDSWKFFVFVAVGVNISNLMAYMMGLDRAAITSGLFGFCPTLVSIAAGVFAGSTGTAWIIVAAGCVLVVPIQVFINKFTNHHGLPGFTFPFICMTWFFMLIGYQSDVLVYERAGALASDLANSAGSLIGGYDVSAWSGYDWGLFFLNGMEEIYVLDGVIASLMCIGAYFWYNWSFALKACLAMIIAVGFGMLMGVSMDMMHFSLYGYSAILTAGALDTFCKTKFHTGRYWFLYFFGVLLTCLINYAIPTILGTFGLPNCTLAFVVAGWIMLIVERGMIESAEKRGKPLNLR